MSWTYQPDRLKKVTKANPPRRIAKEQRKAAEDALYLAARAVAMERDGQHCRICGGLRMLQTHHLERRSSFGTKYVEEKHDPKNLFTVCGGPAGGDSCHALIEGYVLKLFVLDHEAGADGPIRVEKFDKQEGDYIVAIEAA
jgi:hypothetical protein